MKKGYFDIKTRVSSTGWVEVIWENIGLCSLCSSRLSFLFELSHCFLLIFLEFYPHELLDLLLEVLHHSLLVGLPLDSLFGC